MMVRGYTSLTNLDFKHNTGIFKSTHFFIVLNTDDDFYSKTTTKIYRNQMCTNGVNAYEHAKRILTCDFLVS